MINLAMIIFSIQQPRYNGSTITDHESKSNKQVSKSSSKSKVVHNVSIVYILLFENEKINTSRLRTIILFIIMDRIFYCK